MPSVSAARLQELLEQAKELANLRVDRLELLGVDESNLTVPERYELGQVAFHAHLVLSRKGLDAESCQLCACYYALPVAEAPTKLHDPVSPRWNEQWREVDHAFVVGSSPCGVGGMESAMPVVLCHHIKNGKKMVRGIRSVVRLQTLDECNRLLVDASQLPSFISTSPRQPTVVLGKGSLTRAQVDREAVVISGRLVVGLDQRPDKVLQRGAGMEHALADQDAEARRDGLGVADLRRCPAGLEVNLHPDYEGFRVREPSQLAVKGAHCFVSPIELCEQGL